MGAGLPLGEPPPRPCRPLPRLASNRDGPTNVPRPLHPVPVLVGSALPSPGGAAAVSTAAARDSLLQCTGGLILGIHGAGAVDGLSWPIQTSSCFVHVSADRVDACAWRRRCRPLAPRGGNALPRSLGGRVTGCPTKRKITPEFRRNQFSGVLRSFSL